ncbi:unnamed protein product [Rotaria sordida]|uniref:Uncharacterized protein n=2 Tax=Rotaria sordida TaxID=392033 RepID=A0A815NHF7_9BILA|nr:unnamed protein product [Rotaria sordida]
MSKEYYHGDSNRDNHFWVYPKDKELITPRWDTYKASDICDNCTHIDTDSESQIETYQCNGHNNQSNISNLTTGANADAGVNDRISFESIIISFIAIDGGNLSS